jgi:hypothetical protein
MKEKNIPTILINKFNPENCDELLMFLKPKENKINYSLIKSKI